MTTRMKIDLDSPMGAIYQKNKTSFRVFAPTHSSLRLAIYEDYRSVRRQEYEMEKDEDGFFQLTLEGDYDGKFYTYLTHEDEVTDPNCVAVSVNSRKSAIVDLETTNPEGFLDHKIPNNPWQDAIIYEVHVADFTIDKTSGVSARGKFLGMSEENSFYDNVTTGIDHLKELGITHVHLLPVYDYITVDEEVDLVDDKYNYNWGYDPELYNCVEGSYATNPYDPKQRIFELKYLIMKLHQAGISVVLDVVYNHTFKTRDSNFNVLAPYYFHRNLDYRFYNGSGCGNEFASEKPVARKFIIDSLSYWVNEYKVDGFRFDLMALLDIETAKIAIKTLREINSNIIIYGEPWMAAGSLLAYEEQINIGSQKNHDFAIFNPFYRDALRGDNDGAKPGYVQGVFHYKEAIQAGISGSVHKDTHSEHFANPVESINYFNAHDNLIFQDKLIKSGVTNDLQEKMTMFAFSLLMMSQGIPFFHAGNEFLRSKKLDYNSYRSSSDINGIDWSLKKQHIKVHKFVSELIEFRKNSGLFSMRTKKEVNQRLRFVKGLKDNLIGYFINKGEKTYLIIHNASTKKEILAIRNEEINEFQLIWQDGKTNEKVSQIHIDGLASNVYEMEGDIYEL